MIEVPLSLVLADLDAVAARHETRLLLVGAYARDLCLGRSHSPARATNDADFAVWLQSWEDVDAFLRGCKGPFHQVDRVELKMYHVETGLKVDIAPVARSRPRLGPSRCVARCGA